MTYLLNFIIEANLCLLIFLTFYALFLRKETDFSFNRYYILASLCFSLLFPIIHLEDVSGSNIIPSIGNFFSTYWLPEFVVNESDTATYGKSSGFSIWNIMVWLYLSGVFMFALLLLIRLGRILYLMLHLPKITWNNCLVARTNKNLPTFSFFNFILIGQADKLKEVEIEEILRHEHVHVKKIHTIDILLINLFDTVFWFNPCIREYKKILTQLHEFEADAQAVENHDIGGYCNLLARVAMQSADFSIANHFNKSLTLKRITMMHTIKTKMKNWKLTALVMAFPATFIFVACQDQVMEDDVQVVASNTEGDELPLSAEEITSINEVFTVVEQPPQPKDGLEAFYKYVGKNINYPAQARRMGIEGKVYVQFVVQKDGSINEVQAIKGIGAGCDQEAVKVISQSATWQPGIQRGEPVNVRMVIPITFALD